MRCLQGASCNLCFSIRGAGVSASGVYVGRFGRLRPVAVQGDPAPGSTDTFTSFGGVVLNRLGDVAFTAEINGSQGIFATRRGRLAAIALLGDPAPGTAKTFELLGGPLLTGNGQVAFVASLTEVPGGFTDPGLFVGGPRPDVLNKVVAPGDIVEVAPGDLREVSSVGFAAGSGNQDGRPSGFNDRGQAGVQLLFADGSSGIFLARPKREKTS
jgi:hypothetical protein